MGDRSAENHRSARGVGLGWVPAALYSGIGAAQRASAARHARALRRPVISVGSLRVGGSGKTPAVAFIASLLRAHGHTPSVLSRGYARQEPTDGVLVVRDRYGITADVERAGDEPMLLAHLLPGCAVLVGADRHLSGVVAEARLGCTAHILDDGFQHVRLRRIVDLLLVTRDDLASRVLPAGPLREPPGGARRASAWLVPAEEIEELSVRARHWDVARIFPVRRAIGEPRPLEAAQPGGAQRGRPVLLVSGIANPARFEADVRAAGWHVAEHVRFRDHHAFTRDDLVRITSRGAECGADLVLTTVKDAVRLMKWRPLPFEAAMVPLDIAIDPLDDFAGWLLDALGTAGGFRPGHDGPSAE